MVEAILYLTDGKWRARRQASSSMSAETQVDADHPNRTQGSHKLGQKFCSRRHANAVRRLEVFPIALICHAGTPANRCRT